MKSIDHATQKKIWEEEHKKPNVLKQMDSSFPSSGVTRFWDWLKNKKYNKKIKGVEMGCGKGRNVIWLAKQGIEMTGFDFSENAIKESINRAEKEKVTTKFLVQDFEESRVEKTESFFGKDYKCKHHWMIFEKIN